MKAAPWQQALATPQTYGLIVGILLGFGGLMVTVGNRPIAWLGGSGISIAMLGSWVHGYRSQRHHSGVSKTFDWLATTELMAYLEQLQQRLPAANEPTWNQVTNWVQEAQQSAQAIVERDPLLRVEILETLHTVTDLAEQVVEALNVQANVQTPVYQTVAAQHLQSSCDRLQQTNEQLKQLQDQLLLSKLDRSNPKSASPLPQRLQTLIAANRVILEQNLAQNLQPNFEANLEQKHDSSAS
ncbi:MAG: hypothetical protein AAGF24_12605 [Cyanobacteria bacterium P01_H01_bin.121]